MDPLPFILLIPLLVCFVILMAITYYSMMHFKRYRSFTWLVALMALYILFDIFELVAADFNGTYFWRRLRIMTEILLPAIFILFVLEFSGHDELVTRRNVVLILLIPLILVIAMLTNDYHHLFYVSINGEPGNTIFYDLGTTKGILYIIHGCYAISLFGVGLTILLITLVSLGRTYLVPSVLMLMGIFVPVVVLFMITIWNPIEFSYDPTPFVFIIPAIFFAWSIYRFDFLQIEPIARESTFNMINDPIFITNNEGKLVNFNRKGREILIDAFHEKPENALKMSIGDLISHGNLTGPIEGCSGEIVIGQPGRQQDFTINSFPLIKKGGQFGIIFMLRDVTLEKGAEERREFIEASLRQDLLGKAQLILGYLDLMRDTDDMEEIRRILKRARFNSMEQIDLIEQVKRLGDLERMKCDDTIDLVPSMQRTLEEMSRNSFNPNVELINEVGDERVKASPHFHHVLYNLIQIFSNYLNSSKVRVTSEIANGHVLVRIEGDGKDISEIIDDSVLDGTYVGSTAGLGGLRLYLVKRWIDSYEGTIDIGTSQMGGSRFDIYLQNA